MKTKVFLGIFHCVLLTWSCLFPHIAYAQSDTINVPSTLEVASDEDQVPEGLFTAVPALPGSANAGVIMHDSGELAIVPEAPISTQGKLGKMKKIRCTWIGNESPFEITIAGRGSKVLIRTYDNFRIALTINNLTGRVNLRLKGTANGQKVNISDIIELSQHGQFWFETITALDNFPQSVASIPFLATYDSLTTARTLSPQSIAPDSLSVQSTGSAVLQPTAAAKFAQMAWYVTKIAGITASIVTGSLAVASAVAAGGALATIGWAGLAVLGFGAAIAGIYDAVKFRSPQTPSSWADNSVMLVSGTDNLVNIGELLPKLKTKANFLRNPTFWTLINEGLNKLLEKPSHALVNGMALKIIYTWPSSQIDLDTATSFLGQTVGYACGSSTRYLAWTGDDTSSGGREEVTCLISEAAENADLPGSFTISARAGWYSPAGGSGPAYLAMFLENPRTGILYGPKTQLTISPGSQSGCASTPVGSASFTWNPQTTRINWSFN
jgi:hypothetical protein